MAVRCYKHSSLLVLERPKRSVLVKDPCNHVVGMSPLHVTLTALVLGFTKLWNL